MKRIVLLLACFALLWVGCKEEEPIAIAPDETDPELKAVQRTLLHLDYDYTTNLPRYLLAAGLQPVPVNNAKAALGRVLFYDKSLSQNGRISCASCHDPTRAFSDLMGFSVGVSGERMERQSMPLANTANFAAHYRPLDEHGSPPLLWDGRATSVQEVARLAITNPHEMNMTIEEWIARIRARDYYPYLWRKAFGHAKPTETEAFEAIAEFVGAIGAANSPFDIAMERNAGNPQGSITTDTVRSLYYGPIITTRVVPPPFFTVSEFRGMRLFTNHCSSCHSPIRPFQTVFEACNGLDLEYKDQGKGRRTKKLKDNGVFKCTSLRNVALTPPFMHDGRFKTLREVIDFYSTGIQHHPNLHPLLRNFDGSPKRFNFSEQDKEDLVNFLKMLTDFRPGGDVRFSDPFRR
ncbi:MAG: hypothetical protein NZM43_08835 [Saprospiraceae bacterium]|nr:hypothetical protein [Saprospiraceae bacterium]MDW8484417.1 cytochrome c peroxidase [Saprospiraceae bacterium]